MIVTIFPYITESKRCLFNTFAQFFQCEWFTIEVYEFFTYSKFKSDITRPTSEDKRLFQLISVPHKYRKIYGKLGNICEFQHL